MRSGGRSADPSYWPPWSRSQAISRSAGSTASSQRPRSSSGLGPPTRAASGRPRRGHVARRSSRPACIARMPAAGPSLSRQRLDQVAVGQGGVVAEAEPPGQARPRPRGGRPCRRGRPGRRGRSPRECRARSRIRRAARRARRPGPGPCRPRPAPPRAGRTSPSIAHLRRRPASSGPGGSRSSSAMASARRRGRGGLALVPAAPWPGRPAPRPGAEVVAAGREAGDGLLVDGEPPRRTPAGLEGGPAGLRQDPGPSGWPAGRARGPAR